MCGSILGDFFLYYSIMKTNSSSFLQFNNTNVLFTNVNGMTYIAVKPICQALNVVYAGQLKMLKSDPFLAPALYLGTIQVGDFQAREYTCISEKYVYGWIFSIKSPKPELMKFKKECYEILYNHFHGVIGKRKELLLGVAETQIKIDTIKKELLQNKSYKELLELENDKKLLSSEMKSIDKEVVSQVKLDLN
jgi:hypothetical protein